MEISSLGMCGQTLLRRLRGKQSLFPRLVGSNYGPFSFSASGRVKSFVAMLMFLELFTSALTCRWQLKREALVAPPPLVQS